MIDTADLVGGRYQCCWENNRASRIIYQTTFILDVTWFTTHDFLITATARLLRIATTAIRKHQIQ